MNMESITEKLKELQINRKSGLGVFLKSGNLSDLLSDGNTIKVVEDHTISNTGEVSLDLVPKNSKSIIYQYNNEDMFKEILSTPMFSRWYALKYVIDVVAPQIFAMSYRSDLMVAFVIQPGYAIPVGIVEFFSRVKEKSKKEWIQTVKDNKFFIFKIPLAVYFASIKKVPFYKIVKVYPHGEAGVITLTLNFFMFLTQPMFEAFGSNYMNTEFYQKNGTHYNEEERQHLINHMLAIDHDFSKNYTKIESKIENTKTGIQNLFAETETLENKINNQTKSLILKYDSKDNLLIQILKFFKPTTAFTLVNTKTIQTKNKDRIGFLQREKHRINTRIDDENKRIESQHLHRPYLNALSQDHICQLEYLNGSKNVLTSQFESDEYISFDDIMQLGEIENEITQLETQQKEISGQIQLTGDEGIEKLINMLGNLDSTKNNLLSREKDLKELKTELNDLVKGKLTVHANELFVENVVNKGGINKKRQNEIGHDIDSLNIPRNKSDAVAQYFGIIVKPRNHELREQLESKLVDQITELLQTGRTAATTENRAKGPAIIRNLVAETILTHIREHGDYALLKSLGPLINNLQTKVMASLDKTQVAQVENYYKQNQRYTDLLLHDEDSIHQGDNREHGPIRMLVNYNGTMTTTPDATTTALLEIINGDNNTIFSVQSTSFDSSARLLLMPWVVGAEVYSASQQTDFLSRTFSAWFGITTISKNVDAYNIANSPLIVGDLGNQTSVPNLITFVNSDDTQNSGVNTDSQVTNLFRILYNYFNGSNELPALNLKTVALYGSTAATAVSITAFGVYIHNKFGHKLKGVPYPAVICWSISWIFNYIVVCQKRLLLTSITDMYFWGNPELTKLNNRVIDPSDPTVVFGKTFVMYLVIEDTIKNLYKKMNGVAIAPRCSLENTKPNTTAMLTFIHLLWYNQPRSRKHFFDFEGDNELLMDIMSMSPLQSRKNPFLNENLVSLGATSILFLIMQLFTSDDTSINRSRNDFQGIFDISLLIASAVSMITAKSKGQLLHLKPHIALSSFEENFVFPAYILSSAPESVLVQNNQCVIKPSETGPIRKDFDKNNKADVYLFDFENSETIIKLSQIENIISMEEKDIKYVLKGCILKQDNVYCTYVKYRQTSYWQSNINGHLHKLGNELEASGNVRFLMFEREFQGPPRIETQEFKEIIDKFVTRMNNISYNNNDYKWIQNKKLNVFSPHQNNHIRCEFHAIVLANEYGNQPHEPAYDEKPEIDKKVATLIEEFEKTNTFNCILQSEIEKKTEFANQVFLASLEESIANTYKFQIDGDITKKIESLSQKAEFACNKMNVDIMIYLNVDNFNVDNLTTYYFEPTVKTPKTRQTLVIGCIFVNRMDTPSPIFHFFPLKKE